MDQWNRESTGNLNVYLFIVVLFTKMLRRIDQEYSVDYLVDRLTDNSDFVESQNIYLSQNVITLTAPNKGKSQSVDQITTVDKSLKLDLSL